MNSVYWTRKHRAWREQGMAHNEALDALIPEQLPANLDTPEFRTIWSEWQMHRKEKKHKLTESTRKRQLAMLSEWGVERAIAAINRSITQGWTGIFEDNGRKDSSRGNRPEIMQ